MPAYRLVVTIDYTSKRPDSTDTAHRIVSDMEEIEGICVRDDYTVDELDAPKKPDESGS